MVKLTKYIDEMLDSYGSEKLGFITEEEKIIAAKLRGHIQIEKIKIKNNLNLVSIKLNSSKTKFIKN